jgi:hypothetical protein
MTRQAAPNHHPAPAHRAAPESHFGAAGLDRRPGRAQASHHSGNPGRHKNHAARRVPHGVPRAAGPDGGPARVRHPRRAHSHPARGRTVRAGAPPGNSAGPRRGPFPVPDRGLPRPARQAGRNRTLRLGRRGVRSPGSRCPAHRHVRTRPPSHPGGWTGEVPTPRVRPSGRSRGPPPRADPHAHSRQVPPAGHNRVTTPPPACGDHNQPRTDLERQPVRGRAPRLPRACLGCRADPGSPGRPANPRGPPACAGPALSRGTASRGSAAVGTHAGAGHRGTRVRDRRSHAPAARAAVPAGPGRSFVPLPCQ